MSVSSNLRFNFESKKQIEAAKQYHGILTGNGQGMSIQELEEYYMRYKGLILEFNDCFWCEDFVKHSKELSLFVAKRVPDIPFTVEGEFYDEVCSDGDIQADLVYNGEGTLHAFYAYGYEDDDEEDEYSGVEIEEEYININKE